MQPYAVTVSGTDAVAAYRVEYMVGITPIIEYRYRWRMGNVVAGVIVTARVTTIREEPTTLSERAKAIAERQVVRIYRLAQ